MGKVVHCKREAFDVYIGRPGPWGNRFSHNPRSVAEVKCDTRADAIEMYRIWLRQQIKTKAISLAELAALSGKTLGCWCHPKPCHGDVLTVAADWAKAKLEEHRE